VALSIFWKIFEIRPHFGMTRKKTNSRGLNGEKELTDFYFPCYRCVDIDKISQYRMVQILGKKVLSVMEEYFPVYRKTNTIPYLP
jgi:hypothetical protein